MTKFNITTMTDDDIQKLANDILEADDGYGRYSVNEINKELFNLGISSKDGCFLTNLTGETKIIANKLMKEIS